MNCKKSFLQEVKTLILKYWLIAKARWLGFVTDIKILIGIKAKPVPKKRGRPAGSKNKAK